ncbi:hypothetical protein [Rossellomorea sp. NPDC077527]|uniref:hypothetical protein n=1 Tax=Rossellomorea sp. NPDC077527 TaxID=3364510 RepID=UPI0037C612A4
MNKKHLIIFSGVTLSLFIFIPVIVNSLMFDGPFTVKGTEESWISFFGSFWGAILGGIISGGLTLIGVYLTISRQRETDFENKYPKMALKGNKIEERINKSILILKSQIPEENFHEKDKYKNQFRWHLEHLQKEADQVIEWAAGISADCFENVNSFYGSINEMLRDMESSAYYDEVGIFVDPPGAVNIELYLGIMERVLKNHYQIMGGISRRYYKNR